MSDPRTVTVYGASDDLIEIEGAMSNTDVEKAVAWLRTLDQHGTWDDLPGSTEGRVRGVAACCLPGMVRRVEMDCSYVQRPQW